MAAWQHWLTQHALTATMEAFYVEHGSGDTVLQRIMRHGCSCHVQAVVPGVWNLRLSPAVDKC